MHTVEGVAYSTKKTLCDIKGISEAKAEKILDAAGVRRLIHEMHVHT